MVRVSVVVCYTCVFTTFSACSLTRHFSQYHYLAVVEINEALGRNFATPDDLDEADLDAELELLEDELEEDLDELEADATPSYLQPNKLPAHPTGVPGTQMPTAPVDDLGLSMPQTG